MCQTNYTTENKKNKPLDEFELSKIETMLNECYNATQIAQALGRDSSTIQKEIKNFSTVCKTNKECKVCKNYQTCSKTKICGNNMLVGYCSRCKDCKIAVDNCSEYEPVVSCEKLKGRKKVCNGCPNFTQCRKAKLIYSAKKAWKQHEENRLKSVKKYKAIDNVEYMEELSKRIKLGQSPEVALNTLEKDYGKDKISVPTLYKRIDAGKMTCKNIDLRNKLTRKPKNEERQTKEDRNKHRANGRSYHDLTEEEQTKRKAGYGQMDTVIGVPGGKLLLTLVNKQTSFLFGLPVADKKQETIIKELDKLEITIEDKFKLILEKIVTDNGPEFLSYEGIEKSAITGKKRIWLYYADPYASYQKGMIENQHRLIRYFFPKGTDFSKYSDEQIIEKMNRINNYPRKDLGWSTPYKEMEKIIGKELLNKLGFYEIPISELNMTRKKIA